MEKQNLSVSDGAMFGFGFGLGITAWFIVWGFFILWLVGYLLKHGL